MDGRVTRRNRAALFAALVFCACGSARANDVSLTASLDRRQADLGQPLALTIALSGDLTALAGVPKLQLPESFQVVAQSQSSNFSIQSGVVERSVSFYYVLVAREAGTFELGPFEVQRKNGKPLTTDPIQVVVRKPIVPPGSQPSERFSI